MGAAAVLVGALVAAGWGCGGDPGEPAFPRTANAPAPAPAPTAVARREVPGVVQAPPLRSPAPEPSGETEPRHVDENVAAPVEMVRVMPDCRALVGAVFPISVELVVTREGTVSDARVLSAAPESAKGLVLESVRGWRFRPASVNGRPVPVYFTVSLRCP